LEEVQSLLYAVVEEAEDGLAWHHASGQGGEEVSEGVSTIYSMNV
jgi:hypothetical protein